MPDAGFGWQIAGWLWDRRDDIARKLSDVYAWFRGTGDGGRGILIIGPGGVGKTTLARLLSDQFDWLTDPAGDYRESLTVEHYALADDPKTQIVVPPGQHHRRLTGWADVKADLAGGKYRGVILLAADGLHNLTQNPKFHPLYTGSRAEFLAAYRAACREDEVAVVRHLADALRVCPTRTWALSLVTKQDLWTDREPDVVAYYRDGPWAEAVRAMTARDDPRTCRHELVFASLVISNFVAAGERLKKNVEGYDHAAQTATARRLFEVIDSLREWEQAT